MVFDNEPSSALLLDRKGVERLMSYYKANLYFKNDFRNDTDFVLVGRHVKSLEKHMKVQCKADSLILGLQIDLKSLLKVLEKHGRSILNINDLLHFSMIDIESLNICCPEDCVNFIQWFVKESVWECLKIWANNNKSLKQTNKQTTKPRRKRNDFFSYVLREQIKIDSVNNKLSETTQICNQDFKSISKFNNLLKSNLNRHSTQINTMTLGGKACKTT